MVHLLNCPDEVILVVLKYLDSFSLISLSNTCMRFKRFYSDKQIVNKSVFERINFCLLEWSDIRDYMKINKLLITHLDLSYIHWLPKSNLFNAIVALKSLKHLNIIETGITTFQAKKIICHNTSITSLAISAPNTDYLDKENFSHNLEDLHLAFKTINQSEIIFNTILIFISREIIKKIALKVTISFFQNSDARLSTKIDLNIVNALNLKSMKLGNSEPHNTCNIIVIPEKTEYMVFGYHIFIETFDSIYLSSNLCKDVDLSKTHPFLNIIRFDFAKPCQVWFFLTFYICKPECIQETENLTNYAYERIKKRKSEGLLLNTEKCCPLENFDIKSIHGARQLTLPPCLLAIPNKKPVVIDEPLFKKRRLSRIPHAVEKTPGMTVLDEIAITNEKLESLLVFQSIHTCEILSHHSEDWIFDKSSLLGISRFKNLKHLSLSVRIYSPQSFFTTIFEECVMLESLTLLMIDLASSYIAETLTKTLSLCKNINYLKLANSQFRNINPILQPLSNCPTLQVIDISYYKYNGEPLSWPVMVTIVKNCRQLTHFVIEEKILTPARTSDYKRYESILRSMKKELYINLTQRVNNTNLIKCVNGIDHLYL